MTAATLWRHPDFMKLWFGQTVSNLGDRVSLVAFPTVAVVALHGGALSVGILGALRFLPFLLISPLVGVLADRVPRRTIMIVADAGRLLVIASVPIAGALHGLTAAHLYIAAGMAGILSVFFEVSYQSYLPALVGRAGIVEANSKLQLSRSASQVAGGAVAGALMQIMGAVFSLFADALSFLVSAVSLVAMRHRETRAELAGGRSAGAAVEQMKEGIKVLFGQRLLRPLMLSTAVGNIGSSMGLALVLVFAYQKANLSPGAVGAAFAIGGLGFVIGALLATRIAKLARLGPTLALCPLLAGLGYLVVPTFGPGVALAGLIVTQFLVGVAQSIYSIQVMSLVQGVTPNQLMGRVGGGALALVWGAMSLGNMVGGLLGGGIGVSHALIVSGGLLIIGALMLVFSPVIKVATQPSTDDSLAPASPEETVSSESAKAGTSS